MYVHLRMSSTSIFKADNIFGGTAICRKVVVTGRGTIMSLRRSTCLTSQKESAVTKEQIDTLLKWLDNAGVGMNDAVRNLQSARSDALLVSAIPAPLHSTPLNSL